MVKFGLEISTTNAVLNTLPGVFLSQLAEFELELNSLVGLTYVNVYLLKTKLCLVN